MASDFTMTAMAFQASVLNTLSVLITKKMILIREEIRTALGIFWGKRGRLFTFSNIFAILGKEEKEERIKFYFYK
jgi:hypothetical protein